MPYRLVPSSEIVVAYFWLRIMKRNCAAINVANGWDGTILECEEMPEDVIGGPMDLPESRKLLDATDGGYGGMDCEDDSCGLLHDKCGGGYNTSTACCDPELSCVVKNWFYAQCLTEEHAGEIFIPMLFQMQIMFALQFQFLCKVLYVMSWHRRQFTAFTCQYILTFSGLTSSIMQLSTL